MRGKWAHREPDYCQPMPEDTTSVWIHRQVSDWVITDMVVHPEVAMAIAGWYASPGVGDTAVTAFAQTGKVSEGLAGNVTRLLETTEKHVKGLREAVSDAGEWFATMAALRALVAYVKEVPSEER